MTLALEQSQNWQSRIGDRFSLTNFVVAIGTIIALLGALVLAGWFLDVQMLKSLRPDLGDVKPNTAVAFTFCGVSLLCLRYASAARSAVGAALLCAFIPMAIGLLTTSEYLFGVDLGIDDLLFSHAKLVGTDISSGRPAPLTAFNFALIGTALVLLHARSKIVKSAAQLLTIPVLALSYSVLLGYLFSLNSLYEVSGFSAVPLPAAIGQILLGIAILAATPDSGLSQLLLSPYGGGRLLRRILPICLVLFPAMGWARIELQEVGLINGETAIALDVTFGVVLVLAVVLFQTGSLDQAMIKQKKLGAALIARNRSVSHLHGMIDAVPDAIVITDQQGTIVLINDATETLFGYTRDELTGRPVEMLVPPPQRKGHARYRETFNNYPEARAMGPDRRLGAMRKDGSICPVEIGLSPFKCDAGDLVISSIRDITEKVRFIDALQEKNLSLEKASQAKNAFLARMSHELRTPLSAIIGYAGTLMMKLPGPLVAEQERQVSTIQSSAKHLLSLINDVLDFAKIESGSVEISVEEVAIPAVVEDVVSTLRPLAEEKGLRLEIILGAEPLTLVTDRRALTQILINLVGNGIKCTNRGSIKIAVDRTKRGIHMETRFRVTDTGIGIAPEDQRKLFQAYSQIESQCQAKGTGLGLYLSRKLAILLGGDITVESVFGQGSTFTLTTQESCHVQTSAHTAHRRQPNEPRVL